MRGRPTPLTAQVSKRGQRLSNTVYRWSNRNFRYHAIAPVGAGIRCDAAGKAAR
jgi:hypothetical protein